LAGWINKKFKYQERLAVAILFTGSIVVILGLFLFTSQAFTSVFLLFCCSALMYGTNTLLLSVIPMGFGEHNKASTAAGFFDFISYMEAGVTGILTGLIGLIVDNWEWNSILMLWIGLIVIGTAALLKSWYVKDGI